MLAAALTLALLAGLGGAPEPDPRDAARAAAQKVFARQAAAVLAGDEARYLAQVDPAAGRYRAAQRRVFRNLARLPLARWSYEVTGVRLHGDRAETEVRLRYRLRGYDRAPVVATEKLGLTRRGDRWYASAARPDGPRQLWEQGRLTVLRGSRSLVLSAGVDRAALRRIAEVSDRAVPAVSPAWPRPWAERVVVVVPGSVRGMGELLGAPADAYQGIVAVTTSQRGGRTGTEGGAGEGRPPSPADRIVVNPQAYEVLSEEGRQIVMTHEATHVATRAHTTPATPLWLSEGLADWFGYRGTGRTPRETAVELAGAVHRDRAPRSLPSDRDFRFGGDGDRLARAYESGWLACRMIAERWGEERLMALYLTIGERRERRPDTVDRALREVLGVGEAEFEALWRAHVKAVLD